MTRTAAHATEYVRVRPGTHIAAIYGMLWHIFENGWEDASRFETPFALLAAALLERDEVRFGHIQHWRSNLRIRPM
jgi:hypothetical protein